jgi:hypothetical protein
MKSRIIKNKMFKITLLIMFLLVLISIPTSMKAAGLTETQQRDVSIYVGNISGVTKTNGVATPNTSHGSLWGTDFATKPLAEQQRLVTAASSLYDTLYALNTEMTIKMVDPYMDSATRQQISQNYQVQEKEALIVFKDKVGWDSTTDKAQLAALKTQASTTAAKNAPVYEPIYCFKVTGVIPHLDPIGCLAIGSYAVLYITSWVLFVAALGFDWTIAWSLSMYDIINSFKAIQYGWETLRNIINLFFILILVYISIATILRIENYGYKKLLSKLVIAAFLINFSMFFTKIIIDVSNITAIVFYKQIMVEAKASATQGACGALGAGTAANSTNQYLSLGIMNALGLQAIWGASQGCKGTTNALGGSTPKNNTDPAAAGTAIATAGGGGTAVTDPWTMILVGLGGSVFVLILSFIFFAATIMLLLRIVVLIMLIITSPIAFAGNVLPKTSKLSEKWWTQLTSNVLFAPVYMILMFVTLKMIWGGSDKVGGNLLSLFTNGSSASAGSGTGIQAIIFFVLLCAMLIACLTVAASFGSMGAETVQGWGKSLGGKATNLAKSRTFAPVSRLADMASKSKWLSRQPGGGLILQAADKLAGVKVGGSSSRSRIEDDKKTYKLRGELIKKANTGALIQGKGESNESFKGRKEAGEAAEREYFGTTKEGGVTSRAFFAGKQQARQDVLDNDSKSNKSKEAGAKNTARLHEDSASALKAFEGSLSQDQQKAIEDALYQKATDGSFIKDPSDQLVLLSATDLDVGKTLDVVKAMDKTIEKEMKELADMQVLADKTLAVLTNPRGSLTDKEHARSMHIGYQSQMATKQNKITSINGLRTRLTSNTNRVADLETQESTRAAIEGNKPLPAAK